MENTLKIHRTIFPIKAAIFQYCPPSPNQAYAGWNWDIDCGENANLTPRHTLYGREPRLYAEIAAIPLANQANLTGVTLHLPEAWNAEHNEPYFTLYVYEHGDLLDAKLMFIEKKGNAYRIHLTARIPAGSVYSGETKLTVDTWIEQLPDCE